MTISSGPAAPHGVLSRAAVIATAATFGLTYSLSATLIALDLAELGVTEWLIGANAAMHAIGVLAMAPLLPRLVAAFGPRSLVLIALISAAVVLVLFPNVPAIWLWFPLRLALGMASEVLFVLSETWINHLSTEQTRARAMAAYTASLAIGFAAGPLTLSIVGTSGATAYLVGAGLSLAATILVASPRVSAPVFELPHKISPAFHFRLAPLAISGTALTAAIETAGLSFLALYAMGAGWSEQGGTRLITVLMAGAVLLQIPIGWLGDKVDRIHLVRALAIMATLGALAWPFVIDNPILAYLTVFFWGGVFMGIYTIMLTVVGSRFKGTDLVGVYAAMGLTFGAGALVGPALSGIAMDVSVHGLPLFVAAACLAFTVFVMRARRDGAPEPPPGT